MSSIAMLGASALESMLSHSTQSRSQKFKQEFQQLGQDLQSGNTSQAESDLAALQPGPASTTSATPSLVSQGFNQLAQDLQAGNLTAAQSDYTTLQQDLQQSSAQKFHHHSSSSSFNSAFSELQQTLSQLGQALHSGNLSGAQQAYTTLQADAAAFSSFDNTGNSAFSVGSSTGTGVNVTA
jgi:soluble cytochrome b562